MTTVLRAFAPEVWIAEGPSVVAAAGFHYPTRMAVIRLEDGALVIWSPIALTGPLQDEVQALGEVRFLIAPNSLHDTYLHQWQAAFPQAAIHAAPGLATSPGGPRVWAELSDDAPSPWTGEIDQVVVRGNAITTEVVFFHRASGVTLFTDLLQQFPPGWFTGWRGLVARLDLMVGREPTVPRKFRVAFTDRAAARTALRKILHWPTQKVVMAHGAPVEQDGRAFLVRAFGWLKP